MEVFDVSKSAEKEEETESVKDDLEVTNILKTNDKVICIELFLLPSDDFRIKFFANEKMWQISALPPEEWSNQKK